MTQAAYRERDIYAENVSRVLAEHGIIDEEDEMRTFLRGW